jgi:hypothetical protein
MHWSRSAALVALALAFVPHAAVSQLVVRDDVSGWGWLTVVTDRRAIVQLAYLSGQSGETARLDDELLEEFRSAGLRRTFGQGSFEAVESQVMVECTGTDWVPQGSTQVQIAIHGEISYWDHTRLAATEIYEVISVGSAQPDAFGPDAYVEGCTRLLAPILVQLGFDQG